ncbi:MAG: hypothetical protein WCC12_21110 [Anaerolineales bacterium]
MNRNRWIAAIVALLVVLMLICISSSILAVRQWQGRQGRVDQRVPLPGISYCSSRQIKPCVLSFNLNPEGNMVINLLVNGSLQNFHAQIRHEDEERLYECKKPGRYSNSATCTGEAVAVGQTVELLLVSTDDNSTLAAGRFAIIGLALATPEVYLTPTPVSVFDRSPK